MLGVIFMKKIKFEIFPRELLNFEKNIKFEIFPRELSNFEKNIRDVPLFLTHIILRKYKLWHGSCYARYYINPIGCVYII